MEAKSMEIKRKSKQKRKKSNLPIDAITLNETKVKQVKSLLRILQKSIRPIAR